MTAFNQSAQAVTSPVTSRKSATTKKVPRSAPRRGNSITYSNDLTNAAWSLFGTTLTTGQPDPLGGNAATKISADTTSALHVVQRIPVIHSLAQGESGTLSFYAKAAGYQYAIVRVPVIVFDLINGTVVTVTQSATVETSASITPVPGFTGWYFCTVTYYALGAFAPAVFTVSPNPVSTVTNFNGDGVSGMYVTDFQFNEGVFAGPYLDTTSTAVLQSNATLLRGRILQATATETTAFLRSTVKLLQSTSSNLASIVRQTLKGDYSLLAASFDFTPGTLPAGATVSRAGTGWAWDASGTTSLAAYSTNLPRFQHNPMTGALLGLLLEPATTNEIWYSNDITQSSDSTDPEGNSSTWQYFRSNADTPNANTLVEVDHGTGNIADIQTLHSTADGERIIISVVASPYRPTGSTKRYLQIRNDVQVILPKTPAAFAIFDVEAGTITQVSTNPSLISATMEQISATKWRCTLVAAIAATKAYPNSHFNLYPVTTPTTPISISLDGVSGIHLDHIQFEHGVAKVPTSLIPTTGPAGTGAVTRPAEALVLDLTGKASSGPVLVKVTFDDASVQTLVGVVVSSTLTISPDQLARSIVTRVDVYYRVLSAITTPVAKRISQSSRKLTGLSNVMVALSRNTPRLLLGIAAQSTTLARAVGKLLSVSVTQATTLMRGIGHKAVALAAQAATLVRGFSHAMQGTSPTAATLARVAARSMMATSSLVATLARGAGRLLLASVAQATTLVRGVSHKATAPAAQVATLTRGIARSMQGASSAIATLMRSIARSVMATSSLTAALMRSSSRALNTVATQMSTAIRQTSKTFAGVASMTATQLVSIMRTVALLGSATAVANLTRSTIRTIFATAAQIAAAARAATKTLTVSAVQASTASAIKVFLRSAVSTTSAIAVLTRSTSKQLLSTAVAAAGAHGVTTAFRSALAVTSGAASLSRQLARAVGSSVSVLGTAAALKVFLRPVSTLTSPVVQLTYSTAKRLGALVIPVAALGQSISRQITATVSLTVSMFWTEAKQFMTAVTSAASVVVVPLRAVVASSVATVQAHITHPAAKALQVVSGVIARTTRSTTKTFLSAAGTLATSLRSLISDVAKPSSRVVQAIFEGVRRAIVAPPVRAAGAEVTIDRSTTPDAAPRVANPGHPTRVATTSEIDRSAE